MNFWRHPLLRGALDSSPPLSFTPFKQKETRDASAQSGEAFMDAMERRVFLKGASMGVLAFSVGGIDILMTPGEARARAVPNRLLSGEEAETLEALGEALVPGAREAGVAHFIDQQVSVPPGEALLEARIVNVKPPFINFYRAAIGGVDKASTARSGKRFGALSASSSTISSISSARTR
jgi:hypothetical protein